jgi:peptidoglycan/xylan/chitin deacetylase (PgdA/CDA1 family)
MYHSLSDGNFPDTYHPKYSLTRRNFAHHLKVLANEGYSFRNMNEIFSLAFEGKEIPTKTCVLTFDDGHRSSLDIAEEMEQIGATGTFFLTQRYCETRKDFLKDGDVRDLVERGFDFGSHGVTHRPLSALTPEQIRSELRESKKWLESLVQREVISLSAPGGRVNKTVLNIAFSLGYSIVATSQEQLNARISLPASISRFSIRSNHNAVLVCRMVRGDPTYVCLRSLRALLLFLPKLILKPYNRTRTGAS